MNKAMDLEQVITTRRTVYQFDDRSVDREVLTRCLNAAIWAPNHKLTQPWRFYIPAQQLHRKLSYIYAENRANKRAEPGSEAYDQIHEQACKKFMRVPQLVFVGQEQQQDETLRQEDYAACACAIQNFQLMAWYQGLGVQWSTGPMLQDPQTYQALQIDAQQVKLIGLLYVGYPNKDCLSNQRRKPLDQVCFYYD